MIHGINEILLFAPGCVKAFVQLLLNLSHVSNLRAHYGIHWRLCTQTRPTLAAQWKSLSPYLLVHKVIIPFKITLVTSSHLCKSYLSINHPQQIYPHWNDILRSSSLESISMPCNHQLLPRFVVKYFLVPKFQILHQFFPWLFELAPESL